MLGSSSVTAPSFPPQVKTLAEAMASFKAWLRSEFERSLLFASVNHILGGYGEITIKLHAGHISDIDVKLSDHVNANPDKNVKR